MVYMYQLTEKCGNNMTRNDGEISVDSMGFPYRDDLKDAPFFIPDFLCIFSCFL